VASNNAPEFRSWLRVLLRADETIDTLGYEESYVIQLYETWERYSRDGYGRDCGFDTGIFISLLTDPDLLVASRAAKCLAGSAQNALLQIVPKLAVELQRVSGLDAYPIVGEPCKTILSNTLSSLYGDMCPGWLSYRTSEYDGDESNEEVYEMYREQQELWLPVIKYIDFQDNTAQQVMDMLATLKSHSGELPFTQQETDMWDIEKIDPNQLKLDL